jgi:hypothetical protein
MALNRKLGFFVAPMLLALGGSAAVTGCGEDTPGLDNPAAALCCEDFEVGADMSGADFGLEGKMDTQFKIFAQAMGDLSAVAAASLTDVEIACTNIATDMGASKEDIDSAKAQGGKEAVTALCSLASAQIDAYFGAEGEFTASGSLKIDFQEPKCEASFSATADCSAKCDASVECDVEANPPKCEGGKMEVSCEGSCTASADAPSVKCEGACSATCEGACKADVGATVDCQGKCDGTCEAKAGVGTGTGAQADGTCHGTCSGTCEMDASAEVTCNGTCEGSCTGSCEAKPGSATVKCDGECSGNVEPLKCEGGTLKGGCDASADCNANCSASASAKAECTPPSVNVVFEAQGNASIEAEAQVRLTAAIGSIKANLPNLLVAVKARGAAFLTGLEASVDAGAEIGANVGELSGQAVFCAPKIVEAGATAAANMKASVEAAGSVAGSLKIN